ncbi:unnamed protein product [Phytophthora lilii]|uniref:Unnamed protein product n=1 Tax=Phytophthora lilii TaxID=2077276 RepID=A0A9W6YH10_9STRA|nr:unnamed protein product [Phytophthora lilii]
MATSLSEGSGTLYSYGKGITQTVGSHGEIAANWVCMVCTCCNDSAAVVCSSCGVPYRPDRFDFEPGSPADSTADPPASATDDELFYPISGKYYMSKSVTREGAYVTTKKKWNVALINDSRQTPLGKQYRVLWLSRYVATRRYYQRTWEPEKQLRRDGFGASLDLVDQFKLSGYRRFSEWWPSDEGGKNAVGADTLGLCMFNALRRAAELAGRPDVITQDDIDAFVAAELQDHGVDLHRGTSWNVVLRFLRKLRDDGRDFVFKAIKKNFTIPGRRGFRVLEEVSLRRGLYIVIAYNHNRIGHAFVLKVDGKTRLMYDLEEGKPVSSAWDWINFVACIRPFVVFKSK